MVRPAEGRGAAVAKMVELPGVQARLSVLRHRHAAAGASYSHALLDNHGALVRPELLAQLGLSVGDRLMIGGVPFTIRGVIAQEPGRRVGAFSLGSRVMVDLDDLRAHGTALVRQPRQLPAAAEDGRGRGAAPVADIRARLS